MGGSQSRWKLLPGNDSLLLFVPLPPQRPWGNRQAVVVSSPGPSGFGILPIIGSRRQDMASSIPP